jgi:ATP-dependent Lon protease
LEQEFEMLDETRRQLAARTVLRDTLSETDPSNG